MPKIAKTYSAIEMLEVLKKQWLDTKDIRILSGTSLPKSQKIKQDIITDLESKNYKLPYGLVPSEKVVEYLHLNINYLKKIAN